jgi:hypothetical protein
MILLTSTIKSLSTLQDIKVIHINHLISALKLQQTNSLILRNSTNWLIIFVILLPFLYLHVSSDLLTFSQIIYIFYLHITDLFGLDFDFISIRHECIDIIDLIDLFP